MSKSLHVQIIHFSWQSILKTYFAQPTSSVSHFLVTYCSRIMSVTKLTVPLNKINFWKIDRRKVHQASHIHFRYMKDTFGIKSSIEFEHSIFDGILFLFVSFSEEWLIYALYSMQKIICQNLNSILPILLGRFWPFVGLPLYYIPPFWMR
jgi:hypothetical protein